MPTAPRMQHAQRPPDELVALVVGLSSVQMDDYAVVGAYMRFGEQVREQLKDARLRIAEACAQPAKRRDNHLLWAAPGSGKTYFVEQVAASLPDITYAELNLAKLSEAGFREGLDRAIAGGPTICLIDEVDAKPDQPWPYEALMPFLDVNLDRGGGIVFVLAGSSGATIGEFKDRIRARPKGTDVLSRVPEGNGWEIAPMDVGDRILVALSQMLNAASERDRAISGVEKLALHYLAAAPHLANARQLREFAVRAVERGSASSDRIRYDDLFDSGDRENKRYWASVMPQAEALENAFVHIRDGKPGRPGAEAVREKPGAHLPVPATPFFGRESELEELVALLVRKDARLVTLTGPGGTGKTRLALEAASRAAELFLDGVYWVPLASLQDVALVLPATAQALGVVGEDAATIGAALSGQRRLLLLDNLEQLLPDVASTIGSLRDSTDGLTILVTSRERLQLSGERTYAVPGLSSADGVELFVARAAAIGAAPTSRHAVAELCERLEHLPLAIELAAARSIALSPEQLIERLGQRLDLLKGARDADPRQATLRATIEWSHNLLDESERRLFRELSVFRGGCTLEAAEAICAAELETLESLIDKSLMRSRQSADGSRRYSMLETIREFAREQLDRAGDRDRLRDAHSYWYATQAAQRGAKIDRQERWVVEWVASEIDNLRATLTTLLERRAVQASVLLAETIYVIGAHQELLDTLPRIEGLSPPPTVELARLQRTGSESAHALGDTRREAALLAAAAATAEAVGDDVERWKTTLHRGNLLYASGDTDTGSQLMQLAVDRLRELGNGWALASSLYAYGIVLLQSGEPERARGLLSEALEISRREGVDRGVTFTLAGLASVEHLLGNDASSLTLTSEGAMRFAEVRDSEGAAVYREGVANSLLNAAAALLGLDDAELAATLWAAGMRIMSELGIPASEPGSEDARTHQLLEERLEPARLAALTAAAYELEEDQAIALIVEAASRGGHDRPSTPPPSLP